MSNNYTRNWWAIFIDQIFFVLGLAIMNTGTVLPAFSATLTDSNVLVGAASAVWISAWLLPQLFAANFLSHRPQKYPYMMFGSIVSRPVMILFGLLLLSGWFADAPLLLLGIFLLCLAWFSGWDAFVAIGWFDVLGKTFTPRERGKLVGWAQFTSGVLAIGAGWLIGYLLSDSGPAYPANFAAVFILGGTVFMIALAALALIKEPHEATPEQTPATSFPELMRRLGAYWQSDKIFARANVTRLLWGLSGIAAPFYILHATQVAQIPTSVIGNFSAVSSIGMVLAGAIFGQMVARFGSHRVVQLVTVLGMLPPLLGLWLAFGGATPQHIWVYVVIFLVLGMAESALMLGFLNYILDLAPHGGRPTYMGIANTLGGLLVVAPLIGGWILDATAYPMLFAVTAAFQLAGFIAAVGLPPIASQTADAPSTAL